MQNSPELDEEGYSIRPEEPGYILCGLVNPKRSWGSQAGHDFFISPLLFSLGLFFCSQIRLPQSAAQGSRAESFWLPLVPCCGTRSTVGTG